MPQAPKSKPATTIDGVMRRVRVILKEISGGGYWPYLPPEGWLKEAERVIKTGNAFVDALEAVNDGPPRKSRAKRRAR